MDSELASLHERLAVLAADLGRLGHDGHPELVVADHALRRAILLVRDLQTKAS